MKDKINNKTKLIAPLIKELYKTDKSVSSIAKKLKTNTGVVKRCLDFYGIEWKSLKDLGISYKTNKKLFYFNENFFENIDCEEKAYWLGFLAADGYVNNKRGSFNLSLSEKDKEHLIKFKNSLESNHPIYDFVVKRGENNFLYSKITIHSKKTCQDLINQNVFQKKSLTLLPPNIKDEFKIHYIRGYFDGDGGINFHKVKNRKNILQAAISFTSTKEVLDFIQTEIQKHININFIIQKRMKDDKNNYTLYYSGNVNVLRLCEVLYKNSKIFLKRKWERYKVLEKDFLTKNRNKQMYIHMDTRSDHPTWFYDFTFKRKRYVARQFKTREIAITECIKKMKDLNYPPYKLEKFIWSSS